MEKDKVILDQFTFHTLKSALIDSYMFEMSGVDSQELLKYKNLDEKWDNIHKQTNYEIGENELLIAKEALIHIIDNMQELEINNLYDTKSVAIKKLAYLIGSTQKIQAKDWWLSFNNVD